MYFADFLQPGVREENDVEVRDGHLDEECRGYEEEWHGDCHLWELEGAPIEPESLIERIAYL